MDRSNFVVADAFGVDPLADDLIDKILKIKNATPHTVTSGEEGNPQLIAYDYYNNVELYFIILYYNGIPSGFDLAIGTELMIPHAQDVQRVLVDSRTRQATGTTRLEI